MIIHGTVPADLIKLHSKSAVTLSVSGVFSTAVYLADAGKYLWMLHDRQYGSLPFGIAVHNSEALLQQVSIASGMTAHLRGRTLLMPAANLEILLTPTPPVCREKSEPPSFQQIKNGIESARQQLIQRKKGSIYELIGTGPYENLFARCAAPAWLDLQTALTNGETASITAALSSLLGLGVGLTPSLDDFLTGMVYTFLFAQDAWSLSLPEATLLSEALQILAPKRTSDISAAYVVSAAAGEYISLLEDVLRPTSFCSYRSLQNLLNVGGSSGGDMLTGLICALQYMMLHCL